MSLILKLENNIKKAEAISDTKDQYTALKQILDANGGKSVHNNHYLMIGLRERLIQCLINLRKEAEDPAGKLDLMKEQVELFKLVGPIMAKVDLPADFWINTQRKMEDELTNLENGK